jgi:hypothetical protein
MGIDITPGGPLKLAKSITTTGNFTVPTGINSVYAVVYGAGGGGNGGTTTNPGGSGAAGRSGSIAAAYIQVSGGQILSVTIGAGGTAGNSSGGGGGTGGTTSIDTNVLSVAGSSTSTRANAAVAATENVNLAPAGALAQVGTVTFSTNLVGGAGGAGGGGGNNSYGSPGGAGSAGGSGAVYLYL